MALLKTLKDWWLQLVNWWQQTGATNFSTQDPTTMAIFAHIAGILVFLLYAYLRHVLPVRVRCWFCGGLNRLPPANRNRFDCLYCEQYNGFSGLGDYNKDIPAQRDPAMNVFSVGAAPSGKTLDMYHNGLCEMCNHRQTIKMQLRNKFEPKDPKSEEAEFQEYSRQLEKSHALCPDCKNHVRTRLAYQDAKLLPHVMSLEASRWPRRLQRLFNSELTELIICTISAISLAPSLGESWARLLPLTVALFLMLFSAIHNSFLLWCIIVRGVSIAITTAMADSSLLPKVSGSVQFSFPFVLDGMALVCGLVAVFAPVQLFAARLLGRKRTLLNSKFTALPNLVKPLSPLLSLNYLKVLRSRSWATRAPFDLGPRISSLSIGSASRRSSPEFGMFASTLSTFEQTATPRGYSDYGIGGAFIGNRISGARTVSPESFRVGVNEGTPFRSAVFATRSASILWPSKLTDSGVGRQSQTQRKQFGKSSQSYGGPCGDLTPPPSQDSSIDTSEESRFISASRLKNSFYDLPIQRTATEYHSGLTKSGNADHTDWDARTKHTVYSTVVHDHNGPAKALWAIAFLLAAALTKLCWPDFISMAQAIYIHSSILWGHSSRNDAVCAVR